MGWFRKWRLRKAVERLLASEPTKSDLTATMIFVSRDETLRQRVWEVIKTKDFAAEELVTLGERHEFLCREIWELLKDRRQITSEIAFACLRWSEGVSDEAVVELFKGTPTDDLLGQMVEQCLPGKEQAADRLLKHGERKRLARIIRNTTGHVRTEAWLKLLAAGPTCAELLDIGYHVVELRESACRFLLEATQSFGDIGYVLGAAPALFKEAIVKIEAMKPDRDQLYDLFSRCPCYALWHMLVDKGPTLDHLVKIAAQQDVYDGPAWLMIRDGWSERAPNAGQLLAIAVGSRSDVSRRAWTAFFDASPSDGELYKAIIHAAGSYSVSPATRVHALHAARLFIGRTEDTVVFPALARRLPELQAEILRRKLELDAEPRRQALAKIRRLTKS